MVRLYHTRFSLIKGCFYARIAPFGYLSLETWWSGLTYLFAKEAGPLKGLEGSNPSVSAIPLTFSI